ncbi:hypothetical protein, partial [Escherichia coli]|uniref:hypothetical protein n=1 Tax=Escherichia coli TaxID=562 RepID=UPI001BB0B736
MRETLTLTRQQDNFLMSPSCASQPRNSQKKGKIHLPERHQKGEKKPKETERREERREAREKKK